jgi:hypothetical protein
VSPLANNSYIVSAPKESNGGSSELETVLQLGAVETIGNVTLVHVTPLSASLRVGHEVLSQANFPPPAEQERGAGAMAQAATDAKDQAAATRVSADASVRAVASAYLRGEKSSLDVLGLRLGMTVDDADNLIRKAISVGWVSTSADNPAKFDAIVQLRIYVATDMTQAVALTLPHDDQPQHVIAVERILQVASTAPDANILQLLQGKYGAPVSTDSTRHEWVWGEVKPQTMCEVRKDVIPSPQIVYGSPVPTSEFTLRFSDLALKTLGDPNVAGLGEFANCRPTVRVIRGGDNLDTVLWDTRALVSVTTSTSPAAASGKVVMPAIKF